jgi:uncharacterized protein YpiB (UPF0302 family)
MPQADIHLNLNVDIEELINLNYESMATSIDYMARRDIENAVHKHPKYKKFVKDSTDKALEQITEEGVYTMHWNRHDIKMEKHT